MFQKKLTLIKQVHSKQCTLCHYWCVENIGHKFEPHVFNGCHDILKMAYELKNIAILNVKGVYSRCFYGVISKNEAANILNKKLPFFVVTHCIRCTTIESFLNSSGFGESYILTK